jgi:type IV pilus assembly protein PilV
MARTIRQRGFSMIEVLITLFIVAIGVLGMAGLQFVSLKNANSSASRYQATLLAQDLAERMRANKKAALAGNYVITALKTDGTAPSCTSCSPADFAARDIYEWSQLLLGALPGASAAVSFSAGSYTIQLGWVEQQTGSKLAQNNATATETKSLSLSVQP